MHPNSSNPIPLWLTRLCISSISHAMDTGLFSMGTPNNSDAAVNFEEKVRRTVYIDNLSPQITEIVLKTALGQFGNVVNVQFIPNYTQFGNIPKCVLVEMENSKEAKAVISELQQFPFMMSGMPRPVRARPAEAEMFGDRPSKPGRKISFHWLDPSDPDFKVAKRLKDLSSKHSAEAAFLLKQQLKDEERLGKQQNEALKEYYKKYEMMDSVFSDGTARRLARYYNMRLADE